MCLTSSKFTSLVHSCTSWDLYFEDEDEDNADKLARFSSAVKIIKSLKLSYNLDVDYDGPDSYDDLNEDDFYKFLRNHPEIKSMNLRQVNSEILGYIGHFCTDLRKLRLEMTATSRTSFRLGFNKLDTLFLLIAYDPKRKNIDFLLKHVSALPKLRVLILEEAEALFPEVEASDYWGINNNASKMRNLESLELITGGAITTKIIKACSKSLRRIAVNNLIDADLDMLLDNCPNIISVSVLKHCGISHQGYSALFKQLGSRLECFKIKISNRVEHEEDFSPSAFTAQDLEELINSKPTQLTVVSLSLDYKDHITSKMFIRLIKEHGRQFKHLYLGGSNGLDTAVLSAIVENCPLVVEQGEWHIRNWNMRPADISKFVADCGASVKILTVPTYCTDKILDQLASNCPNLHALNLSKCDQVTDGGLAMFLVNCKGLRELDISETKLVKHETFIKETYPNLRIGRLDASVWNDCGINTNF